MASPRPFNIRIFVAEGLSDGLRLVEKSNWVGLGVVCPHGRYSSVKQRGEFSGSGVYLLIGAQDDKDYPTLYIGEGETVRDRLDSHYVKKDFWQQAVVFTTRGDPLNKAEVQYLEARLVELASTNKRCLLDNANKPQRPNLSEAEEAQVEGYLDELLSLLPILGIDAFEEPRANSTDRRVYHWCGKGWDASGYETSNGFAVRAGSIARMNTVPSMAKHVPSDFKKRERLLADGVLVDSEDGLLFTVDHEFSSPSQAAAVCAGRSSNGRLDWKDGDDVSLKEHQERAVDS